MTRALIHDAMLVIVSILIEISNSSKFLTHYCVFFSHLLVSWFFVVCQVEITKSGWHLFSFTAKQNDSYVRVEIHWKIIGVWCHLQPFAGDRTTTYGCAIRLEMESSRTEEKWKQWSHRVSTFNATVDQKHHSIASLSSHRLVFTFEICNLSASRLIRFHFMRIDRRKSNVLDSNVIINDVYSE